MTNKFDELTKSLAQSVTRRAALKKFCVGLAGMALACFGLANEAGAADCARAGKPCATNSDCCSGFCLGAGSLLHPYCGCRTDKDCRRGQTCTDAICMFWL